VNTPPRYLVHRLQRAARGGRRKRLEVIARLFEVEEPVQSTKGKRIVKELTKELLPEERPGAFNQAIMDLGSLICIPANPDVATVR